MSDDTGNVLDVVRRLSTFSTPPINKPLPPARACGAARQMKGEPPGMKFSRLTATTMLVASMALVGPFSGGGVALAGGNCQSMLDHIAATGLDAYRAGASCSSLDADYKARPKLVRNGGPDYTGPWFTGLNAWYFTSAYTCYAGCYDSFELAHV